MHTFVLIVLSVNIVIVIDALIVQSDRYVNVLIVVFFLIFLPLLHI